MGGCVGIGQVVRRGCLGIDGMTYLTIRGSKQLVVDWDVLIDA